MTGKLNTGIPLILERGVDGPCKGADCRGKALDANTERVRFYETKPNVYTEIRL